MGIPYPYKAEFKKVPDSSASTGYITMTATAACDESGVQYYFACTNDPARDSGWQSSNSYTDTGATLGHAYAYTVQVRDTSSNQNMTEISGQQWAVSGMNNLDFEDPAIADTLYDAGHDGQWINSLGTLTRDDHHSNYPGAGGDNWAQLDGNRFTYQQVGNWRNNQNYAVTFKAGQRSDEDFADLYVCLLAGGDPNLCVDDESVTYTGNNSLVADVGATILDTSSAIAPFSSSGKKTTNQTILLSSGTSMSTSDPLWLQFYTANTSGFALIDNVLIKDILMLGEDPEDTTVDLGTSAEFHVYSVGVDTYEWYKEDPNGAILQTNGGDISGATTDTLTIANVETADEGMYYCVLTNSEDVNEISESGELTTNPMITGDPADASVEVGATAQFSVTTGVTVDSYQWYEYDADTQTATQLSNSGDISGATSATLSIANVEKADCSDYYCVVTKGNDSETSSSGILETNPMVSVQPVGDLVELTETAQFTVGSNISSPSYQWYKLGDPNVQLSNGGDISGATSTTLSIANVDGTDLGGYFCTVTYGNDSEDSDFAYLSTSSIIDVQPSNAVGYEGDEVSLTVASSFGEAYQWYKVATPNDIMLVSDGVDIFDANTATLTLANLDADDDASYYCEVTSHTFSLTENSDSAALQVRRLISHFKLEQDLTDELTTYVGQAYNSNSNTTNVNDDYEIDPNEPLEDGYGVHLYNNKFVKIDGSGTFYNFWEDEFTASCWIRVDPAEEEYWGVVVAKQNNNKDAGWLLRANNNGAEFRIRTTGGSVIADANTIDPIDPIDNHWHQIAATYDGEYMKVYIDGIPGEAVLVDSALSTMNSGLTIGASNAGADNLFAGIIDEVKIYSYALSDEQIDADFKSAKRMVAHYQFEQDLNDTVSVGSGGYYEDDFTTSAGTPTYTEDNGYDGYALSLDGSGDHVRVADSNELYNFMVAGDYTMTAWVKADAADGGIVSKQSIAEDAGHFLNVEGSSGQVEYKVKASGVDPNTARGSTDITDGDWHIVTAVRDGNSMSVYVDGVAGDTKDVPEAVYTLDSYFCVGAPDVGGDYLFEGLIDNVKLYNFALSQDQIIGANSDLQEFHRLVGHWKFERDLTDEQSTLTAVYEDSSNNVKAEYYFEDIDGGAMYFDPDSSNRTIQVNGTTDLYDFHAERFSASCWVKIDPGEYAANAVLVGKQNNGNSTGWFLRADEDDVQLRLRATPSTVDNFNTGTSTITDRQWHLITSTFDGTTLVTYFDGVASSSTMMGANVPIVNNNAFRIGAANNNGDYPFKGLMDNVKIWNYALTSTEVAAEYSLLTAAVAADDGLRGFLKFEQDLTDEQSTQTITYENASNTTANPTFDNTDPLDGYAQKFWDNTTHTELKGSEQRYNFWRNAFSVNVWVNVTSEEMVNNACVVGKVNSNNNKNWFLRIEEHSGTSFKMYTDAGASSTTATNTSDDVCDGTWHMLTITYDGTDMIAYIDGNAGTAAQPSTPASSNERLVIGARDIDGDNPFAGLVDNFRIYDKALSSSQIAALYAAETPYMNAERLAFFCSQWLNTNCDAGNSYCGGADFEPDGDVDLHDFAVFCSRWMAE